MRSAIRIASSGSCVTTIGRGAGLAQDRHGLVADRVAQAPVEVGERLVHEEHARTRRDRARQRHPLLLAAGEDMRVIGGVALEPDPGERALRGDLGVARREPAQAEGDVLDDAEMREKRVILEHQADAAGLRRQEQLRAGDLAPVEEDAPLRRALDAGRDPEQRRLAAAGMAEQADELARRDRQRDVVERAQRAVDLAHALESKLRRDRGARRAALAPTGKSQPVTRADGVRRHSCDR